VAKTSTAPAAAAPAEGSKADTWSTLEDLYENKREEDNAKSRWDTSDSEMENDPLGKVVNAQEQEGEKGAGEEKGERPNSSANNHKKRERGRR
jgi:hypothetical protein